MTGLAAPLSQLVRPWRGRLALVAVGVLAAAGLDILPALIVRRVVDALSAGATANLPAAAVLYLTVVAVAQILTAGYGFVAATVAQRALATLRTRLFAHLLALDTGFHDRTPAGDSIARATADIDTIDDLFSSSILTVLGDTVRLFTVTAAMVWLSPRLSLVVLIVIPPVFFFTGYFRRRIRDAERTTRAAVGQATAELHETLAGVEVVRAFGRQERFAARFRATLLRWLSAGNRSTGFNAFYTPVLATVSATVTAALLWTGGSGAADTAGVSIGTLTAFVLLLARLFVPLINLGDEWQSVQAALAGAERVFGLLAVPAETRPVVPHQKDCGTTPPIVLRGVGFAYRGGRPVLHGIDLEVGRGEHVALVGRSGAGKTTVLALLAGLYRPDRGTVRLGGTDPAGLTDAQRRRLLGFVPQTVHLFTGTIGHNIALGDDTLGGEEIEHACRVAGADAFIRALPQGYDTVLSDSARGEGVVLSAGQRQLLALARALAGRPRVLLLDEATAVVDGASDAAFRAALREHVQPLGTAILTVAHRLATARDADRVIVLSAGRVLEQGTPDQLLATDSTFAALLAMEESGWHWESD